MATRSVLVAALVPKQPLLPWRPPILPVRRLSRRSFSAKYRRWDSKAETARSRSFGFGFGRGDQKNDDEEEQNDDDEEEEEGFFKRRGKKRRWWSDEVDDGPSGGILDEVIDAFWVFKVFKAYGWLFPFILISWLLSSGPKAFLMAMAIPIGQSALALAFDKLWGGAKTRPKRRPSRMRRKRPAGRGTEATKDEEEAREPRSGYQSWVASNRGSVQRGGERETGFGGWDDLEGSKSAERPRTRAERPERGKMSRRERKTDTPLLLRLLIAVFPFLGSWTKMLW